MKKSILLIFLLSLSAMGQDMMRLKMKDGTLQSIPLNAITKITFYGVTAVDNEQIMTLGSALKTFALLQNYPNPFNPTTTIQYHIPRPNTVLIRIHDITGRLVRTLLDEYQSAGEYRLQWDGKNNHGQLVGSGMYLYDIRYEGSVLIRKMMLLK